MTVCLSTVKMKACLLMSLAALLSVVTVMSCNYTKELLMCAPCSEWIMDNGYEDKYSEAGR
jgi:hypothetical protein